MKDDDIDHYGVYEFGDFDVHLAPCMGKEHVRAEDAAFFEVLVSERRELLDAVEGSTMIVRYSVDLHTDPRFLWYDHFGKFERRLTPEDIAEYNARCATMFHKIDRPLWRLARHSIHMLEKKCQGASKPRKGGKKKRSDRLDP